MIGNEILNYRIISLIGKGGMGSVYYAEHKLITNQKVAIKVINADMVNDFTRDRLKEEAEHLAELNHPNIVHFIDYHIDEKGNIYLIMEYANGKSLDEYINSVTGLIVEDKICALFEPILDAVGYAHAHNIIHRDIKPANIIITKEGIPKILDFGIATIMKQNSDETEELIMGTPSYMSPEQVKGEKLDVRSDVYSLGVLLHQMMTGNAPYDTTTLTEHDINKKVVEEQLPRMRSFYKYVSEKVQKIVDKATAKDKNERYQSCGEFKKELHRAIYPPKMPRWAWMAIASCVLLLVGCGTYLWDYNRTKVYYYKDYVEQWGVPQGIGEVSGNDTRHTHRRYRFEYCKRKLLRVSHINSVGKIIPDNESERNERPLDQWLYYTSEGKVSRVKVKDASGKVLYVKSYNEKLNTMSFQYDDKHNTERIISGQTVGYVRALEDNTKKGRISRWWIEYDENGFATSVKYAGLDNSNVGDDNHIFGRTYQRDEKGRVTEIHYIGMDGQPKATRWGLGIKKFYYDENDDWVRAVYLTVDGKPAYDDVGGVAIFEMEYDKYGNVTYAYHKDGNGNLMVPKKNGVAGFYREYDDKGFLTRVMSLGIDKKPIYVNKDGYAGFTLKCDENGYTTEQCYLDPDGKPCISSEGYSKVTLVNEKNGDVLEAWFYDLDGKLCETTGGNAGYKCKYDSVGNLLEYVNYDKNKKPCLDSEGKAGYRMEYDERNLRVTFVNIGLDLKPCKDRYGIIIVKDDYDKRGNSIKKAYYDASGKNLILSNENIAGWTSTYDDFGNETEYMFFNVKREPCLVNGEYAKKRSTYDEHGNIKTERFYDMEGNLTLVNGIAGTDYICDERGNVLENKPIGVNGKLANGKLIIRNKYDKSDNLLEYAVFSTRGPALNSNNIHRSITVYNSRNQEIEIRYYDTKGNLTLYGQEKIAIQKNEFNDKGDKVKTFYYGTNLKPIKCTEGWSSSTYEYDVFGNIIKQCFYDVNGQPTDPKVMVPVGICKYDKWNNRIYLAAQDGKGNFVINPNTGWAIQRAEYDSKIGKLSSSAFFDEKDRPMLSREGYHKIKYQYDSKGNTTEQTLWGIDGKPMLCFGFHKEIFTYNEFNKLVSDALYGITGKPVNCNAGFQKMTIDYNDEKIASVRKYYTAGGKLFATQYWNGTEWVSNMVSTNTYPSSAWIQKMTQLNAELPQRFENDNIGGGVVINKVLQTGDTSCQITFKSEISKYELSNNQVDNLKLMVDHLVGELKKELNAGVKVNGILYDAKGRTLYSVTR